MTLALLVLPFVLLLLGVPIFALLIISALAALLLSGSPPDILPVLLFGGLDSYPLVAVPFFILAGEIMGRGGLAKRLINLVLAIIGSVRGSLALTTIASSELFGTMSGSAVGCVAAIGRLLLPALKQGGYSERFGASLIASSGAVAIIIPPSIAMIIYGVAAQQSISALFIAGFLPGLLIGLVDGIYVYVYARRHAIPVTGRFQWRAVIKATREASWALGAPFVIFGGIYGGIFTPTEAAGIAIIYSALVSRYIYKDVTWADIWDITVSSAEVIAQILIIVAAASIYAWFLTTGGLATSLVNLVSAAHLGVYQLLFIFNLLLLVIGSVVEPPAAILMLTPLFAPIMQALGVDLIHFGIIVTVNLSIGMYTPPLGLNILAAHSLFGVSMRDLFYGVMPFLVINLLTLLVITYVPQLSLMLVR